MTWISASCITCGQEEGVFPSMKEAVRVLQACGWVRSPRAELWNGWNWEAGENVWYCGVCAHKTRPFSTSDLPVQWTHPAYRNAQVRP